MVLTRWRVGVTHTTRSPALPIPGVLQGRRTRGPGNVRVQRSFWRLASATVLLRLNSLPDRLTGLRARCTLLGRYGNVYKCRVVHTPGTPGVEYVAVKKFKKAGCVVRWRSCAVLTVHCRVRISGPFLASTDPGSCFQSFISRYGSYEIARQDAQSIGRHQSQGGNKCRRELAILKLISADGSQNPHLVRLLDHFVTQTNKLCLVFEYIDRTLLDIMDQYPNGMEERQTKSVIFQVLQGLRQLHETHNVMHRDVKPENVLFDRRIGIVKLCDLGFAREDGPMSPDEARQEDQDAQEMTQYVSTRWYRAPELLLRRPRYSKSIDVWSVGCLVVEMLAGKPAFPAENDLGVLGMVSDVLEWRANDSYVSLGREMQVSQNAIGNGQPCAGGRAWDKARRHATWLKRWLAAQEEEVRDFILMCLRPDPEERATVHELLDHPWISNMGWMDGTFAGTIQESMSRTASIQARVMACKRLRMALLNKSNASKDPKSHRQQSMVMTRTSSKASHLIKPAYYTPQIAGLAAYPSACNAPSNAPSNAATATATGHHQKKTSYWLETPSGHQLPGVGALVSPKLNPSMVPEESTSLIGAIQFAATTPVVASTVVAADPEAVGQAESPGSRRSLAKRLLDKLKF